MDQNKLWAGGQGVPRLLERLSSQSPRPPYGKHTTQHSNHRQLAEHPDLRACVRARIGHLGRIYLQC